jgi:hypothetical protein
MTGLPLTRLKLTASSLKLRRVPNSMMYFSSEVVIISALTLKSIQSQNEKRKDKELTERINRIKKEKDESMRGVDIRTWKPND